MTAMTLRKINNLSVKGADKHCAINELTSLWRWMVTSQTVFEIPRHLNALRLHHFLLLTVDGRSLLSPFGDRLEACCVAQQRFTPLFLAISVVHLFTCLARTG